MSREGVQPVCCKKACCDWKDMLQDLYDKTINSYRILNGLYPDGTGELRITAGDGIIIDTVSGNEVQISADELASYSAIAPIQLDTDLNTISIAIDDAPTLNSTNAVRSGGTYAAIRARGSSSDPVEEATHATDADNQTYAETAYQAEIASEQASADTAIQAGTAVMASQAVKLQTARSIQTDLASAAAASFDGTADVTPGVTGVLPIANGGTGSRTQNWVGLTGAQSIYGNKNFDDLHANTVAWFKGITSSDHKRAQMWAFENEYNSQILELRFYNGTSTAYLYLRKQINGSFTDTLISSM